MQIHSLLTKSAAVFAAVVGLSLSANAQSYVLYNDAADEAGFNERHETDGSTYIADTIIGSGAFGTGDALRIADLSDSDKPEVVWNSAAFGGSDITTAFRVDLDALNNTPGNTGSVDINMRFSDSGDSIGSSGNQLNTISFEESGRLKINGSTVHTFSGATSVSFLTNVDTVNPIIYTAWDQTSATLAADSIATFVNGVLVDTRMNNNGAGFDPLSGVNKFGFTGESDSKLNADYLFDNITLLTGSDAGIVTAAIPEPSSLAILGLMGCAGCIRRRR